MGNFSPEKQGGSVVCIGGDVEGQVVWRSATENPIISVRFLYEQYVYFIFSCIQGKVSNSSFAVMSI
jgi:hypothetical protein